MYQVLSNVVNLEIQQVTVGADDDKAALRHMSVKSCRSCSETRGDSCYAMVEVFIHSSLLVGLLNVEI